jgi:hypothetical protein
VGDGGKICGSGSAGGRVVGVRSCECPDVDDIHFDDDYIHDYDLDQHHHLAHRNEHQHDAHPYNRHDRRGSHHTDYGDDRAGLREGSDTGV